MAQASWRAVLLLQHAGCLYPTADCIPLQPIGYGHAAVESLVEAVATAKPDCSALAIQRDNGSQYTGKSFRKAASNFGIKLKLIWKSTPWQNCRIESFHGSLKQESIRPHDFANYREAEAVIAEAFRDYNQTRPHSALPYVPPDEFAASWEAGYK